METAMIGLFIAIDALTMYEVLYRGSALAPETKFPPYIQTYTGKLSVTLVLDGRTMSSVRQSMTC